ncbi:cytochrome c biogenesis heme-transporting ATPase CcmA [Hydrogenophaga sp. XSHU_21]
MGNHPQLTLDRLACERGGQLLFEEVDLSLGMGQWLRVLGANGAGKTSLLRLIVGLMRPLKGQVLWRGQPVGQQREAFARDLFFLGHAPAVKDDLDPVDNLLAASALAGHPASRAQALQALGEAGMAGYERVPVRRLSQGQRRRCSLARLPLARTAPLWVLDEPWSALDADATRWLNGLLRHHLLGGGLAVLTSHLDMALDDLPHVEVSL